MSSAAVTTANTTATTRSNTTTVYTTASPVTTPIASQGTEGQSLRDIIQGAMDMDMKQTSRLIFDFLFHYVKILLGYALLPFTFMGKVIKKMLVAGFCFTIIMELNIFFCGLVFRITIKLLSALRKDEKYVRKWLSSMDKIISIIFRRVLSVHCLSWNELSLLQTIVDKMDVVTDSDHVSSGSGSDQDGSSENNENAASHSRASPQE